MNDITVDYDLSWFYVQHIAYIFIKGYLLLCIFQIFIHYVHFRFFLLLWTRVQSSDLSEEIIGCTLLWLRIWNDKLAVSSFQGAICIDGVSS